MDLTFEDQKDIDRLKDEFKAQVHHNMDILEDLLLELETDETIKEEDLRNVKHIIHSIKGSAGAFEAKDISKLCHQFENKIVDTKALEDNLTPMLHCIDQVRKIIDEF